MYSDPARTPPPRRKTKIPGSLVRLWRRYVKLIQNPPPLLRLLYFLFVSETSYIQYIEIRDKHTRYHWFLLAGALWSAWQAHSEQKGPHPSKSHLWLWFLFRWFELFPRISNTALSLSTFAHEHLLAKKEVAEKEEVVEVKRTHGKLSRRLMSLLIEAAVFGESRALWPVLGTTAALMVWMEMEGRDLTGRKEG